MFNVFRHSNSEGAPVRAIRLIAITAFLVATVAFAAACAGEAGAIGAQGPIGADGAQGDTGPTGPDIGAKGVAGATGEQGPQGETGPLGTAGEDAASIGAGDGLVLANDVISADFAGSGSADTIARSDHEHAAETYTKSEVDAAIAVASATGSAWSAITDVPAGFADGTDADILGSLSCTAGQVPAFASGSWSCSTPVAGEETPTATTATARTITNVLTTISSNIANGQNLRMAIGVDGLPLIAFYDRKTRVVNTVHCADRDCTASNIVAHTSAGNAGEFLDLAIGADGRPVISLYDNTTHADQTTELNLKLLRCDDIACTSSSTVTVDETADVGQHNSVTIRSNGMPVIAYRDFTSGDLKFAFCKDTACSSSDVIAVDTGTAGTHTDVVIGFDGLPLIAYRDEGSRSLRVAHCTDEKCLTKTSTLIDSATNTGEYTALIIGADGLGTMA